MMGLFLVVHGLIHYGVAAAPNPEGSTGAWMLNPSTSVFSMLGLGTDLITGIGIALVGVATIGFILSGIGILTRRWEKVRNDMIVISSLISLAALLGFFNIYWVAAIGIDVVLIALFASDPVARTSPQNSDRGVGST